MIPIGYLASGESPVQPSKVARPGAPWRFPSGAQCSKEREMDARSDLTAEKARSRAAFESLRDALLSRFEALEDALAETPLAARPAGRFVLTPWQRRTAGSEPGVG